MASARRKAALAAREMKNLPPHPTEKFKRCEETNKRGYKNRTDALAVAIRAARQSPPQRIYRCPFCKHWHLTSKPHRSVA